MTNLTPYLCTSEPLKYALTIPPNAEDPQHRDWRDPDVLCDSPRALSTTIESTTCIVFTGEVETNPGSSNIYET